MPDKSRGPKAPRDLSGVKPTFEVFNEHIGFYIKFHPN